MPAVLSIYALLLDSQQGLCGSDCYCVYRTGDRAALRKLNGQHHDSSTAPYPKAHFDLTDGEPVQMFDKFNTPSPGQICRLVYRASLASARVDLA